MIKVPNVPISQQRLLFRGSPGLNLITAIAISKQFNKHPLESLPRIIDVKGSVSGLVFAFGRDDARRQWAEHPLVTRNWKTEVGAPLCETRCQTLL